jgi:hypothetical protein
MRQEGCEKTVVSSSRRLGEKRPCMLFLKFKNVCGLNRNWTGRLLDLYLQTFVNNLAMQKRFENAQIYYS